MFYRKYDREVLQKFCYYGATNLYFIKNSEITHVPVLIPDHRIQNNYFVLCPEAYSYPSGNNAYYRR